MVSVRDAITLDIVNFSDRLGNKLEMKPSSNLADDLQAIRSRINIISLKQFEHLCILPTLLASLLKCRTLSRLLFFSNISPNFFPGERNYSRKSAQAYLAIRKSRPVHKKSRDCDRLKSNTKRNHWVSDLAMESVGYSVVCFSFSSCLGKFIIFNASTKQWTQ